MSEGYKITEVGEIPDSWKVIKLLDTGKIVSGGTPDSNVKEFWNGNIAWCTPTDITALKGQRYIYNTTRTITIEGLRNSSATLLPKGSLVICTRATIGDCAINQVTICTNQGFKSIIPNEKVDIHFIFYMINFIKQTLLKLLSRSTFLEISKKAFENITIALPPKKEQQKIAEILTTVDEKIDVIDAQITQIQELKKGMAQQLLTKGLGHKIFKNSLIGEILESWETKTIDQFAQVTTGSKDTQNKVVDGVYPFFVRSEVIERINSYSFDGEAVLTAGDGVGVGKVFHYIIGKFDYHQRVYNIHCFSKGVLGKFFFEYFKKNFILQVKKYNAKGSVNSVRMDMITKMLVPIPPLDEQEKIATILSTIAEKFTILEEKKARYQELNLGCS